MHFDKPLDATDEHYSFSSDVHISTSVGEMDASSMGDSQIEVAKSDGAIQLRFSNEMAKVRLGWFESAQEIRQLADFLYDQADTFEAWNAYCDEISEEYEQDDSKNAQWLEDNYKQAPEFWEDTDSREI